MTLIDELSHIQSRVRDGEKWEMQISPGCWYQPSEQTVEALNHATKHGAVVRLVEIPEAHQH